MAFTLADWNSVIKKERARLSNLVYRARKAGIDVKLSDIAGAAPRPQTIEEAKNILAEYKAWTSYHDVVTAMNNLGGVQGFVPGFDMNIPVPEATPGEVYDNTNQFMNEFYNYMSTSMSEDNLATRTFKEWWTMLTGYFSEAEISQALEDLISEGIDYKDLRLGSEWQDVVEVSDFASRLMHRLKHNSATDDLAADDAIAEWTNRWEDIEQNKSAFYAEWYRSHLI